MRALKRLAEQNDSPKRLWMPPSLSYFGPRICASKLLIFSQWAMVPDAIAALLSYDSERAMGMGRTGRTYTARHPRLLNFRHYRDRLTGLRVLPLVIPSPTLAAIVDPLEIFAAHGPLADAAAMRGHAVARLDSLAREMRRCMRPIRHGGITSRIADEFGRDGDATSETAANWDWACAAHLDVRSGSFRSWLARGQSLAETIREDGQEAWQDHVAALKDSATDDVLHGQPDHDHLLEHLVDLALGSPATCALRALHRVAPELSLDEPVMLNAAARIGMAFRGLFNQPESQALLRGESDEVYWQSVLHHCVDHDLQAVLDEYVHLLVESEGVSDADPKTIVDTLSKTIDEALSLKPAQIDVKRYRAKRGRISIDTPIRLRGRFATRLLQQGQEDGAIQRTDTVRTAFNSPFRPFVLASTSVGQEGLDFHAHSHRLVHWNLPSNPVDMEQREGRVHRYKNHAVRLNLSSRHSNALRGTRPVADPWQHMFEVAHACAKRPGDMEPYWILEGPTSIERYALSLPFSREVGHLSWLKRSVALYRLAFGQPRQDDLLSLLDGLSETSVSGRMNELQISLRPMRPAGEGQAAGD